MRAIYCYCKNTYSIKGCEKRSAKTEKIGSTEWEKFAKLKIIKNENTKSINYFIIYI